MKMIRFYKEAAKRLVALALAAGIVGVPEGFEVLRLDKSDTVKTYTFEALAASGDETNAEFSESTGTPLEDDELTGQDTQTTTAYADAGFGEITTTAGTTVPSGPVAYVGDNILKMEQAPAWDEPGLSEAVKNESNRSLSIKAPSKEKYSNALSQSEDPLAGNYYTLTVSTGINAGDNVEYFAVRYTDSNGNPQTKYIFPKTHSLKATRDFINSLKATSTRGNLQAVELESKHSYLEALGYSEESEPATKALASWTVDDFMFEAKDGIKKVNSIEAFLSKGSWTVQGISVSKVNSQANYGEYGFYSGKYFLAIDKTKVCELKKKKQGTLTIPATSDTLINIGGSDSIYFDLNSSFDDDHIANPLGDIYSIRLDIADELKAGIESYLRNDPSDNAPASKMNIEHIAVEIEYQDKNGWTRSVTMPLLLSMLGQYNYYNVKNLTLDAKNKEVPTDRGNVRTVGLCQRGDTVAFTACLPEFKSLISTKVYVGSKARERLSETGGIKTIPEHMVETLEKDLNEARKANNEVKALSIQAQINTAKNRIKKYDSLIYALDNDDIAISSISIYEGTCVMGNPPSVSDVSSSDWFNYTVDFAFQAKDPLYYSTTTKSTGFVLNSGTSDTFSMRAYKSDDPLVGYKMSGNFMVRIKTDSIMNAGTSGDVNVKLSYQNSSGQIVTSRLYNIRDEVTNYLGYWPSDKGPTSDYSYQHGVSGGNIVEFPVTLDDVVAVTGVELSVDGHGDQWQVDSVSIGIVDSIGKRYTFVNSDTVNDFAGELRDGDIINLRCKYNDRFLAVSGQANEGTNVFLSDDSEDNSAKWRVVASDDGRFSLVSLLSFENYALDTKGGSTSNGTNIQLSQKKTSNNTSQLLRLMKNDDGSICLLTECSRGESCIDYSKASNMNVHQWKYYGIDNQKWYIDFIERGPGDDHIKYSREVGQESIVVNNINDGDVIQLRAKHSGLYLSYSGSPSDRNNVFQSTKANAASFAVSSVGDGWYQLVDTRDTSFVLDRQASGGTTDGANIFLFTNNYDDDKHANQTFKFNKNDDGTYTIIIGGTNEKSCLDVNGASTEDGANIIQCTLNGGDNQKWYVEKLVRNKQVQEPMFFEVPDKVNIGTETKMNVVDTINDGEIVAFRAKHSDLYMSYSGAPSDRNNLFQSVKENAATFRISSLGDGWYQLLATENPVFVVDRQSSGGTSNGANVFLYTNNNAVDGRENQRFKFVKNDDGTFTIIIGGTNDKSCLDVDHISEEDGANIMQQTVNGGDNQKWYVERIADESEVQEEENEPNYVAVQKDFINDGDTFILRSRKSGLYLAVEGDAADGAKIVQKAERDASCVFMRVGHTIRTQLGDGDTYAIEVIRDENRNPVDVVLKPADPNNYDQYLRFTNQFEMMHGLDSFCLVGNEGVMLGVTDSVDGSRVSAIVKTALSGEDTGWYAEEVGIIDKTEAEKNDERANFPYAVGENPYSADGDHSDFYVVRYVEMTIIPPFPLKYANDDEKSLIMPGQSATFASGTGRVVRTEDLDFNDVRYSMSYLQTQHDYGYTRSTKTYDVTVKVADDPSAGNINGDSGSSNYFYFQLQFKYGGSALVLANQQLSSDGFRAGHEEIFAISVNRDYGELSRIRIIPEDIQEDSDVFDKLNIENITVTERVYGDTATQYVIDNVGWIGIDYHDSAEDSSIQGRAGRSIGDIAKTFGVSYHRIVVNLLAEVNTLPWDTDYLQVEGSISCDLEYIDTDNQPQTASFDVVKRMAEYMNKVPRSFEGASDGSNASLYTNMGCVSDPQWMLRPNHTDRFMLPPLPNLKSLSSITFYATSRNNKPGKWVIGSVSISRIIKDGGIVTLNSNGEYFRTMEIRGYCEVIKERKSESLFLPAGTTQSLKLRFAQNVVDWIEYKTELSSVSRLPDSTNDELNIYIYPSSNSGSRQTSSAVKAAVQYTVPYSQVMQAKQSTLSLANAGTADAVFFAKGVSVPSMNNLVKLGIQCRDASVGFDHAIIEQVRDGVVINTYHFTMHGESGLLGILATPDDYTKVYEPMKQTLMLSLGPETVASSLFAMTDTNAKTNNIAVAMRYTSTLDPGTTEYYSPYVYLTDVDINRIAPGMMLEIPFDIPYVKEIKGYKIASFGSISAKVKGAMGINYTYVGDINAPADSRAESDFTIGSVYSSDGTYNIINGLMEYDLEKGMEGEHTVAPLTITFKTADAMTGAESGTDAAVQAFVYYTDSSDSAKRLVIGDLRNYIQKVEHEERRERKIEGTDEKETITVIVQDKEHEFKTGSYATVKLFLPDCNELKSIWVCPYGGAETNAMWKLESIEGRLGISNQTKPYRPFNRRVDAELTQQKAGTEIALFDVTLSTQVVTPKSVTLSADHVAYAALDSGQTAEIFVNVTGGDGAYDIKAAEIVSGVETPIPVPTLSDKSKRSFKFTPPDNESGSPKIYCVTVCSSDIREIRDLIYITVESKPVTTTTEAATTTSTTVTTAAPEAPPPPPSETTTEAATQPAEPPASGEETGENTEAAPDNGGTEGQ